MIYFDKNKEAFGYEIPESIAHITDDLWMRYAGTDKWDIINGEFVDITDTPEYIAKKEQERKARRREELTDMLAKLDEKAVRSLRAVVAGTATDADRAFLAENERQVQEIREELAHL